MNNFVYRDESSGYHDNKKERSFKRKKGRSQGDFIVYFSLHNIISMLLFFTIATPLGFFERKTEVLSDIFSLSFIELIGKVFVLILFTGLIARFLAFYLMRLLIVGVRKREMKKIGELNQGINKISIIYILSVGVSSILFSIGALTILQYMIFNQESLLALIATYLMLKIGVYLLIRFFSRTKL